MFKKILIFLVIVIFCSGCYEVDENSPQFFPFTKWQSKDKSITLYISDDQIGYGSINIDDKNIDVYFDFYNGLRMWGSHYSEYFKEGTPITIEDWEMDCSEGEFTATVIDTTYFEIGEEIVFELVEEKIDESEIPYPEKTGDGSMS
ncbi:MAG: hypothetical protein E7560_04690 [Ruminococcaceae bacterium]|nr:hypothetical protein [Oscillospiraceae bacterium]